MKNKIFSILQIVITVFFVYFTVSNLDLSKLFEVLNNINILYLIIAASIYFSSQIISSERLRYILSENNFKISFKENGLLYLKGGDLTEEMKGIKHDEYSISSFFKEDYFETKKIIYIKST